MQQISWIHREEATLNIPLIDITYKKDISPTPPKNTIHLIANCKGEKTNQSLGD